LEAGVFRLPALPEAEIGATKLALILGGIDLSRAERRRRFSLPARTA